MDLSLTAVATRQSRKAILRNLQPLQELREEFAELPFGDFAESILMATLIESGTQHFRPISNSDGIYQVEVGYGDSFTYKQVDDSILLQSIFEAICKVIYSYPNFTCSDKEVLHPLLDGWRERIKPRE